MKINNGWYYAALYGVVHLLVDAASISFYCLLLRQATFAEPLTVFLLYAVFAFVMQAPLGYLTDRLGQSVIVTVLGCLLVAAGACLPTIPLLGLLILGLGNALFHVGGGSVTLSLSQCRATLPGIFVAPGTLGVAIGVALGVANFHPALLFALLLVGAAFVILLNGYSMRHISTTNTTQVPQSQSWGLFSAVVLLLGSTVALRQIVGGFESASLKEWLYAVPAAVCLGKSLGGIFADRFGWHRFTVMMLLLSIPLFWWSSNFPLLGVVGLFCFSMSMPVTLAALSVLFPGRPGTAFGLASLALALGAFIALSIANDRLTVLLLGCLSTYLFHYGMVWYNRYVQTTFSISEK